MVEPNESAATGEEVSNGAEVTDKGSVASEGTDKGSAATTSKTVTQDQPAVDYAAKYKELQRAYTQETQRRATIEKQNQALEGKWGSVEKRLEEQAKHLAELRKQPYDREKFLAEFQDKGPEILKPLWLEDINAVKTEYGKTVSDLQTEIRNQRTAMAVQERRFDSDNYPGFRKLEPVISEMLNDPNCPVDFSKPIGEVIDVLYSLARQSNSAEAIAEAEKAGAKKAEANLVRESRTTVTSGGKAASTSKPDLQNMKLDELRKHLIELNGIADRD
jgi:hypothetical protein